MRQVFVCFFMILAVAVVPFPAAAQQAESPAFLQNLNDVPLMPGLYEMLDSGVVFDQPDGRIVEAEAAGEEPQTPEIQQFYRKSLPQFGWKYREPGRFSKDGETLRIAVEEGARGRIVHFSVQPGR